MKASTNFTFLHIANAQGVILADYNTAWKEQRRFGLMTLRNFGLGKQTMEQNILRETDHITQLIEQSVGMSNCQLKVHRGCLLHTVGKKSI